jgi:hypothetical protein
VKVNRTWGDQPILTDRMDIEPNVTLSAKN